MAAGARAPGCYGSSLDQLKYLEKCKISDFEIKETFCPYFCKYKLNIVKVNKEENEIPIIPFNLIYHLKVI